MDNLTVRKPEATDLGGTLQDLVTVRAAPPLVVSAAAVVVLTGSIVNALVTVGVTSFLCAFWARLVSSK